MFFTSFFLRFFADFCDFGSILGGPGPSKNRYKIEKIDFLTRSVLKEGCGRVLGGSWDDFGRVLGGFWQDFEWILKGFWEDFGKIF